MKKQLHLLTKFLLSLTMLCVGTSAWGAPSSFLSTLTGQVGTNNNDGNFAYGNKKVRIAAGETYVYTLTNYNNNNNEEQWKNWVVEANNGSKYFDCEARGNKWQAGGANEPVYTPVINTSDVENWQTAYNGATVTITISRNAAGTEFTVTHISDVLGTTTGNTDKYYGGTFTVAVDASDNWDVYLTQEYSHFVVSSVVYTNASGNITHYELKNVDLSEFTGDFCSYDAGVVSFSVSSNTQKWCTLDLSDYYSGITGTITNVNMSLTNNIECVVSGTTNTLTNRFGIGVYGNTRSSFDKPSNVDVTNSVTWWGIVGNSAANRIYYTSSSNYINNGLTLNADAKIDILMDMVNKKFSYIQDGTTKVDNHNYIDTEISQPKYLAVQTWSTPVAASIKNMTLEVVYLETTYYTAAFTNTTSGNAPSVTIYSDSERTSPVTNGMLEDGETYYYTATEVGYQNYNGSFTVSGSDPNVEFAMTAKTAVTSITVKYKLGDDEIASEAGNATGLYVGENYNVPFRLYVQNAGKLYKTTANGSDPYYGENVTLTANTVVEKAVTEVNLNGGTIVLLEDLDDATSDYAGVRASYCSAYGNKAYTSADDLEAGLYTFIIRGMNKGRGSSIKVGDTKILDASDIGASNLWGDKTIKNINIPADGKLTFVAGGSSTIDYFDVIIAIKQSNFISTITSAGWATCCSPYALDLEHATNLTDAFIITGGATGVLTKTSVKGGTVPANTGLLLKGAEGTVTIPVVASSTTDVSGNKLEGKTASYNLAANGGYVLMNDATNGLGFYKNTNAFTVGANTAYLPAGFDGSGARFTFFSLEDADVTAISEAKSQKQMANSQYFDLQGRKVAKPQKGLYIVNGKKVVIK